MFFFSERAWTRRLLVIRLASAGLPMLGAQAAGSDSYPSRTVRIVSPVAPGTGIDDFCRLLAERLTQRLGQPFIVENRVGGATILAADHVAQSDADGYTLLFAPASTMLVNPLVFKKLPYQPERFVPVARLFATVVALVVPAASPHRSVANLVADARGRPGELSFGHTSAGYRALASSFHRSARIEVNAVPYRSAANLVPDLVASRIDHAVLEASTVSPLVQSNRLRALAIVGPRRSAALPDVPTLAEAGQRSVDVTSWLALFAPAGTPSDVVERVSRIALEFVDTPTSRDFFTSRGNEAAPGTAKELALAIAREGPAWKRMVDEAGIVAE